MNLQNLMKEAQKMQQKMQEAQRELENLEVIGKAGGGLAQVIMTGKHLVKKLTIADELLDEPKEMIEDIVAAAVNDAVNKIEKETRGKMSQLTSGLNLPPNMQSPLGGDTDKE